MGLLRAFELKNLPNYEILKWNLKKIFLSKQRFKILLIFL